MPLLFWQASGASFSVEEAQLRESLLQSLAASKKEGKEVE
jgi:hypothetical protein